MNEAIELHDSVVTSVSPSGRSVVLTLRPAYVHCSEGCPGVDVGTGSYHGATLTISNGSISECVSLPNTISEGSLWVEGVFHDNVIPAAGEYEGPIELRLVFQTAETFNARADGILIALDDVASACMQESFKPRAVDL